MCVSNVAGNELFFGFAAEQIAICNENAELCLVNWLQTLQNYQFAITRDNCGHIFKSVKAAHCWCQWYIQKPLGVNWVKIPGRGELGRLPEVNVPNNA